MKSTNILLTGLLIMAMVQGVASATVLSMENQINIINEPITPQSAATADFRTNVSPYDYVEFYESSIATASLQLIRGDGTVEQTIVLNSRVPQSIRGFRTIKVLIPFNNDAAATANGTVRVFKSTGLDAMAPAKYLRVDPVGVGTAGLTVTFNQVPKAISIQGTGDWYYGAANNDVGIDQLMGVSANVEKLIYGAPESIYYKAEATVTLNQAIWY